MTLPLTVRHESIRHCVIEDASNPKRWIATVNTELAGKEAGEAVRAALEQMAASAKGRNDDSV